MLALNWKAYILRFFWSEDRNLFYTPNFLDIPLPRGPQSLGNHRFYVFSGTLPEFFNMLEVTCPASVSVFIKLYIPFSLELRESKGTTSLETCSMSPHLTNKFVQTNLIIINMIVSTASSPSKLS